MWRVPRCLFPEVQAEDFRRGIDDAGNKCNEGIERKDCFMRLKRHGSDRLAEFRRDGVVLVQVQDDEKSAVEGSGGLRRHRRDSRWWSARIEAEVVWRLRAIMFQFRVA